MLRLLPLFAAVLILCTFLVVPYSARLDALLSRIAFTLFDGGRFPVNKRRERTLRTASIGTPYREYATKTYLYTFGTALSGAIIGIYIGAAILAVAETLDISAPPSLGVFTNLPDLSWVPSLPGISGMVTFDSLVFLLFLGSSAVVGFIGGVGAYTVRWKLPEIRSDTRRRQIDAGMPRMVAFIYALTRGGMAFPDVMRALSRNEGVFGEGASEVGIAVRNMDLFSVDLVTAVQGLSQQTPSNQFERFSENLGSVLQSGRNISTFLKEEYERYREEAEEQQEEILELLATTAEVYVTTVVAGMLFLVTILLIIGLTTGDTLLIIQAIAYIILPAGNLLFLAYLAEITQPLRASRDSSRILAAGEDTVGHEQTLEADGGHERAGSRANWDRLRAYDRIRSLRSTLAAPVQSAINQPTLVFYVTVPLVVAITAYRLPSAFADGTLDPRVLDDILVQSALVLMATFAVVYETSQRRLRRLEEAVPDLLERLASLNEAGIAVVSSFDRVRSSDVGALDEEVDRIWRDIQWGATVAQALDRFEDRVRTPSITRVVTLITNAMRASNEIGPVLRIAAEQARADQRLRRQRRQEMFTYLVVIYVSFIVFLIVIIALDYVLIPNLPDTGAISGPGTGSSGFIGGFESGDVDDYRLAFFHTAIIQSALSGLVGGMMGAGSIKDGVKHSTIMLTVTYVILTLLG
ncbi:type II secretion system F family protein [Natronomonas halophila]|uniref:type II secretion system F family protein n=1 Tax=Natronomonas halophila TaxID=2747817 RepID=UPI0015B382BB|nr:type II secretion system F family protein [Natronomonas halophila]QLD86972.1 type II secretion system F family protein [Natronomonas halophila]